MTAAPKRTEALIFLALSLALALLVFGDALWGRKILAPVDIAPAMWSRFGFIDPQSDGIPQNHHVVDQLTYDLPLQWTIYHAWRRGEVPWWDPFTYCGRPLLADAHCNAADPIRILVYLAVPDFVLAYNWTLILHRIVGALGMWLLLRWFGFPRWVPILLASAWEFAGFHAVFWGHPWVAATFVWYPWLWYTWDRWIVDQTRWARFCAPLLCTAIICAGNLQSHGYLPLFALAWVAGGSGSDARQWWVRAKIVAVSGILGAMLAAPVLMPELELFRRNERLLLAERPWPLYDALLWASSLYPWMLGTFRTVGYNNFGFLTYIGSIATVCAAMGTFLPPYEQRLHTARRIALVLVGLYLVVLATPLNQYLYARSAGLAVLGLIALAGIGVHRFAERPKAAGRWAAAIGATSVLIAVGAHAEAWIVYPKLLPRIEQLQADRSAKDGTGGRSNALRKLQLNSFANEVTFANPEAAFAWLGLVALAACLGVPALRTQSMTPQILLTANLVPMLWFTHRFVPRVPAGQWEKLRTGSEEQRRVVEEIRGHHLRLRESAPNEYAKLFPMNIAHLHGIHVVHGYAALQPRSMNWDLSADASRVSDRLYDAPSAEDLGILKTTNRQDGARFSMADMENRPVQIAEESLHQITVALSDRRGGQLIRTDTYYPGWTAKSSGGIALRSERTNGVWTAIEVPEGVERVILAYSPTGIAGSVTMVAVGVLGIGACLFSRKRSVARMPRPFEYSGE